MNKQGEQQESPGKTALNNECPKGSIYPGTSEKHYIIIFFRMLYANPS